MRHLCSHRGHWRRKGSLRAAVVGLALGMVRTTWTSAAIIPPTLEREYEPIVLYGSSFEELQGLPIDSIRAFAYSAESGRWRAIPFQIDEVNNGDYFTDDDGLLDADDELVFLSADVGARVPDGVWIPGEAARSHLRVEIEVVDPLDETRRGWVYLYIHAPDSLTSQMPSYLSYDPGSDRVQARYYLVGYDSRGILVDAHITQEGGGQDIDIVDRQKQRVKGKYRGTIKYNATEENIQKLGVTYRLGPVRLLRRMHAKLVYYSLIQTEVNLLTRFYPRSFYIGGGGSIKKDYGVYHIRQSLDLNRNATGMYFFNAHNDSILIDMNQSNDGVDKSLETPAKHWMMVTGDQGTILTLIDVPRVGDVQRLYYRDASSGTEDGTEDTGDGRSYGDIGVYVYTRDGRAISGEAYSASWVYFLPANQSPEVGERMLSYWENPLRFQITPQGIDSLAPSGIYDLIATAEGTGGVRLEWTAPGDDGNAGQAERYDIRYSRTPPPTLVATNMASVGAGDYDLDTWFRDATPLADSTAPLPAGERESRFYTGFSPKTRYYFALRAIDDAQHKGPISNIAFVLVVPVELSAFSARVASDSVILHWTTQSETNNLGFAIERSGRASEWQHLGFVPGYGTTSETHRYRFVDRPPGPGTYMYRLKQIDFDGNASYSRVIRVEFVPSDFQLVAYPNPFNDQTRIRLRLPEMERATVQIFNAFGRRVKTVHLTSSEENRFEFTWNGLDELGRQLPSGIYVVRAEAAGRILSTKILLVR